MSKYVYNSYDIELKVIIASKNVFIYLFIYLLLHVIVSNFIDRFLFIYLYIILLARVYTIRIHSYICTHTGTRTFFCYLSRTLPVSSLLFLLSLLLLFFLFFESQVSVISWLQSQTSCKPFEHTIEKTISCVCAFGAIMKNRQSIDDREIWIFLIIENIGS